MPSISRFWTLTAMVLALGCGSEPRAPKPPELGQAFSNLPLPPEAQLVSQTGGTDALQITLRTTAKLDDVVGYYRSVLGGANWRLVSDIKNPDGTVVLYAEQDGPPLWVRIWKEETGTGTLVQLSGAVVPKDSVRPRGGTDKGAKQR
jgi:hypothetical protein